MTRLQLLTAACAGLLAASLGACNKPTTATTAGGAAPAADTGKIAAAVKADADQGVADFNAHDADKSASHDAADYVFMFHGAPNTVGAATDLANTKKMFAADSTQHLTLANETVDVAASGDMAVFHSTYVFTGANPKTKQPMTDNGNFLAGYKPQPDGSWKMEWSVVSDTGPPPAAPAAAPAAKS
jgi:ketosteroid isomerase-like protein